MNEHLHLPQSRRLRILHAQIVCKIKRQFEDPSATGSSGSPGGQYTLSKNRDQKQVILYIRGGIRFNWARNRKRPHGKQKRLSTICPDGGLYRQSAETDIVEVSIAPQ